jgi:hypothetical protein
VFSPQVSELAGALVSACDAPLRTGWFKSANAAATMAAERTSSRGTSPDTLPALSPQDRKHSKVINCLTQLQSLNLDRPEGMVIPRRAEDIVRTLPHVAKSPTGLSVRERAIHYHEEIEELIELHREFSRGNQRLWKKVTRAVQLVSDLYVMVLKKAPSDRDPNLSDQISSAFNSHQEEERQRLKQVKSAFQLLKETADSGTGRIKKSKMDEILKTLGVDKILEVARKNDGGNYEYGMSIMERVNLCADFWLEKAESKTQLVNFGDLLGA